tara:strand:- start:26 stop:301 length:276 start_codon:yes stop_codon:yes gene_type:complete
MGTKIHKSARDEGTPQWRHLMERERAQEKKKKNKYSGKKIGKKLPDGTYEEVSTPDCDWHKAWRNPEFEADIEELRLKRLEVFRAKKKLEE